MSAFTICYWIRFTYHHRTISLYSYCAPSNNCTRTEQKIKCSNIRKSIIAVGVII